MENNRKLLIIHKIVNLIILINGDKVNIPNLGTIQGSVSSTSFTFQNVLQFKGIPYAESPGKGRRFQAPVPKASWNAELDVTNYGRPCPSPEYLATLRQEELNEDLEDCLNLNIFTKNLTSKNPVMVFIHGGAFVSESGNNYPAQYLLEKDIVLVVMNYRLGVLGFASTRSNEIPGNVAVLDIILALKWVQKYIGYFGGDESRVTVFGLSAGSALTSLLLISPAVPNDLFKNVILHSGVITANWAVEMQPINISQNICKKSGCSTCDSINDINNCLKTASVKALIDVVQRNEIKIRLAIDDSNKVLPKTPNMLLSNSSFSKSYQVMGGVTRNDGSFIVKKFYNDMKSMEIDFQNIDPIQLIANFINNELPNNNENNDLLTNLAITHFFNRSDIEKKNYDQLWTGLINLATYIHFTAPLITFMTLYSKSSPSNLESNYLYSFNYKGSLSRWIPRNYPFNGGVAHCDDVLYLFPFHDEPLKSAKDIEMSQTMLNYWTNYSMGRRPISDGIEFHPMKLNDSFLAFNEINKELTVGASLFDDFVITINNNSGSTLKIQAIVIWLSPIAFNLF